MEVYAGEKARDRYGNDSYLPEETLHALRAFVVSIKGPLGTPVAGGIRSLNVAIRQAPGSLRLRAADPLLPRRRVADGGFGHDGHGRLPREHGGHLRRIEWPAGSAEVMKLIDFLQREMSVRKIRFPASSGIGIKPVSREGSERLVRKALQYAVQNDACRSPSCTRATS
jgi:isocitrate dehydrogenase